MIYPWHEILQEKLQTAKQAGRLPHALLFGAVEGCGHETFILQFAQSLLCLQPNNVGSACGECRSCGVFQSAAHPDFIQVKTPADKQVIGVDQIRALNHFLELSRSYSPVRVAIITDADRMNINAANSLLKTLEEPARDTHIILLSYQSSSLLPTVRSRCQQIRMALPLPATALSWLEAQQLAETPATLLELAAGRPLDALALDNRELIEKQEIWLNQLVNLLQNESAIAVLSADWSKQNKRELLDWQITLVQKILQRQFTQAPITSQIGSNKESLSKLKGLLKNKSLWELHDDLLHLKTLSTHPLNTQLFSENMLSLWLK